MKRTTILIIGLIFTFISFSQTELIMDEQFNDNSRNWSVRETPEYSFAIQDGKYIMEGKNGSAYWDHLEIPNLDPDLEDFTIESSITLESATENYGYGLVWGMYRDNSTYHYYLISPNQMMKTSLNWTNNESKYMDWTSNTSINTKGVPNKFKIEKRSNIVRLYLNDKLVYQGGSFAYFGSKIGFYIGNNMKISIDYLKVTKQKEIINLVENTLPNSKSEPLGAQINTPEYSEVVPVITADGKTLYCSRKNSPENVGTNDADDIWYSTLLENGEWSKLVNIGKPLNNPSPNFVISVSPDNNTMLVGNTYKADGTAYGAGLSITHKSSDGWEVPTALVVDGLYNDNDYVSYFLGADNKTLLLAIENKDGYGVKDLYVSFIKEDNTWTKPLNLGATINSFGEDDSPYLAADNKTLYYSSNGIPGYGMSDIFVTKRLDDTWTNWSEPKNLGSTINTSGDDLGFFLTAKGDYAYLSSGGDICRVLNPERPEPVVLISGKVFNKKTGATMGADINYSDLGLNKELGTANSHPTTGEYKIVLPIGKVYSFMAQKDGFYANAENIDVKTLAEYKEIHKDLYLTPIEKGQTMRLNNLFFEFNKSVIKSESYGELDRLLSILQTQPEMKIEIGGHTDDVGSDEYNLNLSKERANSVINYLVTKGISKDRLTAKGYGETKPEVPNTSDENRAVNRRVEFKIL